MTNHRLITVLLFTSLMGSLPVCGESQARATARRSAQEASSTSFPEGVSAKDVRFYSEGIQCYGKIFAPKGLGAEGKAPAVVLAPGWSETAASIEMYAAHFASRGLVSMIIDYRGWGKSGGLLQTVDAVKTDDRLRFSQMTARVRIRRKRLIPQQQILDIRNALFYLQGEPGVDRARVGVWGAGMAGAHAIVIAATDARVKAAVAQAAVIEGKDVPRKASAPTGALLQAEQRRARSGELPISAADVETRLALAEYHPFWYVEQIPTTTAVLFVTSDRDTRVKNDTAAIAASKLLKGGPTEVVSIPGVTHTQDYKVRASDAAAKAAADWFLKHL
jgi:dipeptidyl aminopeptidase/acylaminoacyl peptidase